jgi:predicted metal-dependent phosphoesterase TrpH
MRADLHAHSTASDGTLTPAALVARAVERGIVVLALTDHDSVAGVQAARDACSIAGITLVTAVELSAVTEDGRDVHMLGYHIDDHDEQLLSALHDLRDARYRRAETMVAKLSDSGYNISLDTVLELSDGGAVGRSHVARALVREGHAESVAHAFQCLIGHGRPFYVPKDVRTPEEAIACIAGAGGIAVIAHPGVNGAADLIPALIDAGLRGIEAYHADHTTEQVAFYAQMAEASGLLVTGGTDFHGPDAPNPDLGSIYIPEDAVRALLAVGGLE